MRAPLTSRRRGGGLPIGLAAGGLALAGAVFGAAAPATALSPNVEVVRNGGFNQGNRMVFWSCESGTVAPFHSDELGYGLQGFPGPDAYSGCTQQVPVEPNATYRMQATVAGPYAFVGTTGAGTTDLTLWSSTIGWNTLSGTVTTGPATTSLTVYFHGWYGQGPYQVARVSLVGPGTPPDPCAPIPPTATTGPTGPTATPTATAVSTPTPSCSSTPYPSTT
ncbi:carbohydrate binding domain-containing protein [Kitasatospora sp. NPDC049285]|uniref:carbohydrate binding domain-containing protein n=1 Tax=Kitasatospora sp. NPDC049285 TaxID=3157096 RepID=UPI00343C5702